MLTRAKALLAQVFHAKVVINKTLKKLPEED